MPKQPQSPTTVQIDITGLGLQEVPADSEICVIKLSTIEGLNDYGASGELWPHDSPASICDRDYTLAPLSLEAGGTLVSAKLFAAHVAAGSPALAVMVERREVTVYASAADAYERVPPSLVLQVIEVSRHGDFLQAWEIRERARKPPRRAILDALRNRLQLYADHHPVVYLDLGSIIAAKGVRRGKREAVGVTA